MIKLGGHFMSLSAARQFALRLGIDVGEDTDHSNLHMEWPINNWLCENMHLHVKSAVIRWPRQDGEYGVIFISKFARVDIENNRVIEEDVQALRVKKWLEGLGADNLQWATLLDTGRITLGGFQPQKSDLKFKIAPPGYLESRLKSGAH
ncbi:hypothetical protein K439DRAFT_1630189 [Ramaria rubella]|nr:hypothetical protein K439DRAFT_1630189 [Ramaria rubella]